MLDTLLHPVVWSYGEQLALEPSLLARYAQARKLNFKRIFLSLIRKLI